MSPEHSKKAFSMKYTQYISRKRHGKLNSTLFSMYMLGEIAWVDVGSRSSVARAPADKAGGPTYRLDFRWLPWVFSLLAGLLMLMG